MVELELGSCFRARTPSSARVTEQWEQSNRVISSSHCGSHDCLASAVSQLSEVVTTVSSTFSVLLLGPREVYPLGVSRKQVAHANE